MEPDREGRYRRMLETRLRDPEFRARYERLYADMLEELAPATEYRSSIRDGSAAAD